MMKKALFLLVLMALLLGAARADGRVIIATADWTPPDLTELQADALPELLVLKVAQEEIGYVEGPLPDESKYGEWYCNGRVAWCAEFITWCVDQVEQRYGLYLMDDLFPRYGGSKDGAPFFIKRGRFISDDGKLPTREKQWLAGSGTYLQANGYIPYPGDYIWFYYYSRKQGTDHVALVEGVSRDENGKVLIHVIEGNNPDRVQRAVYDLTDKRIYGYGTPVKRAYSNLRLYNQNDDVALLQQDLIALGYYELETGRVGYFTQKVQSAVRTLQKAAGLSLTGIVDISTRAALEAALKAVQAAE